MTSASMRLTLAVCPSAGEEHQVQQLVEGTACGKRSADDGAASHRRAAENCREEELPPGGKGQRPQQAAERRCSGGPRHVTPPLEQSSAQRLGWRDTISLAQSQQETLSHAQRFIKQKIKGSGYEDLELPINVQEISVSPQIDSPRIYGAPFITLYFCFLPCQS